MLARHLSSGCLALSLFVISLTSSAERSTPVTVVNGQTNPVVTENAFPRQPYIITRTCSAEPGKPFAWCNIWNESTFEMVVIETISIQVNVVDAAECANTVAELNVLASNGGVMGIVYIPLVPGAAIEGGPKWCLGTVNVRVYGPPLTHGQIGFAGGSGRVNVFGYTLNASSSSLGP